jgi:hypothetical protein
MNTESKPKPDESQNPKERNPSQQDEKQKPSYRDRIRDLINEREKPKNRPGKK